MATWAVETLNATVDDEILALPEDMQARLLRIMDMLQDLGPQQVGLPHVRPLGKKLWEMRTSGRDGIGRAIYVAASGRRLVILRAFVKKTQETPQREIRIAMARLKELRR